MSDIKYDNRPTTNDWKDKIGVTVSAALTAPNVNIGLILPRTILESIDPEVYMAAILEKAAEKYVEVYWDDLKKLPEVKKAAKAIVKKAA